MALKGGSMEVTGTAAALSAAVAGRILARSISFIAPAANTTNLGIGGAAVEADGHPSYVTLTPGASYTPPVPADGQPFDVDFSTLYARAVSGTQVLQIVYID